MKKYLLTTVSIILILAAALLLTPIGKRCAALFTLTPAAELATLHFPEAYYQGEEALKKGNVEDTRHIIEEGKAQAKDSNEYYRFEVLDAKYYFYTMQTDSFMNSHHRLRNYIDRNNRRKDGQIRLLELECEI